MENGKNKKIFFRKKIMWIEDDEFFGTLITKKLSETGCTLIFITNGEEAIKIIGEEKPDLVILDILLPGMSGFEVLEKMRADENVKNIPVLVLSNLGGQDNVEKAASLGVKKYLIKTETDLSQIVEEIGIALRVPENK